MNHASIYLWKKFFDIAPIAALICIEILLYITNVSQSTVLTGWDNLHPEFNLREHLVRSVVGVWQEYRGLGLYDGQSHIANLVHTLFSWVMSLFLDTFSIRYTFTFFMHLLGGLGVYFLLAKLLKNISLEHPKRILYEIASFLGALWYMLNIGTIQMFYTPLEAFTEHYALLPWFVLYIILYFQHPTKRTLMGFLMVTLVSTPQFFIPTLLLPVILLLGIFIAVFLFLQPRNASFHSSATARLKLVTILIVSWLLVNAFWLLPYLNGLTGNARIITQAKMNQISTDDVFLRNKARGDLSNVLLYQGISLDFEDVYPNGSYGFLMEAWRKHNKISAVPIIAWTIAGMTLTGLFIVMIKSLTGKNNGYIWILPFGLIYLTSLIILGNDVPGLSNITEYLQGIVPLFREAYRYPFTKFIHLFTLAGTVLFSIAVFEICIQAQRIYKWTAIVICITLTISIGFLAFPAFFGYMIHPFLKVKIPDEYSSFFEYMKDKNHTGRIATLPEHQYWSWKYYSYGYRGSGFIWWGLPQPAMDRAFDPWSNYNENYYWELSYALYRKDPLLLESVFDKYDIATILLDENIITTGSSRALFVPETKELLASMPSIRQTAVFGKITVYERFEITKSFIRLTENLPTVTPTYNWTDNDVAYQNMGDYISSPATNHELLTNNYSYPFRSLFTKRSVNEREFEVTESFDTIMLTVLPGVDTPAAFTIKSEEHLVFDSASSGVYDPELLKQCGLLKSGTSTAQKVDHGQAPALRFHSLDQRGCLSFGINTLSHAQGYLVAVESRHVTGRPLTFSLINQTVEHTELETYLSQPTTHNSQPTTQSWQTDYFILPPLADDGLGYTVYVANDSIGRYESINDLGRLRFYTIPYQEMVSYRLPADPPLKVDPFMGQFSVEHPNPAYYKVVIRKKREVIRDGNTTLILSQAYHTGWKAYVLSQCQMINAKCQIENTFKELFPFLFGKEINDHVLVNNWANGWVLPEAVVNSTGFIVRSNTNNHELSAMNHEPITVILFFWPQLLQWLGFLLLPVPFLALFFWPRNASHAG